jgi:hypothetical protein
MIPHILPTLGAAAKLPVEVTAKGFTVDAIKEIGVVLGTLVCLAFVITYFSYRLHVRRVDRIDLQRRQPHRSNPTPLNSGSQRKRRRRKRSYPTLAEERGLPPKRTTSSRTLSRSG